MSHIDDEADKEPHLHTTEYRDKETYYPHAEVTLGLPPQSQGEFEIKQSEYGTNQDGSQCRLWNVIEIRTKEDESQQNDDACEMKY